MKKYRLETVKKNINNKKTSPVIEYFEIMASDKEDAKRRFYMAAGEDANVFVLDVKEIEFNRPELKHSKRRKSGAIDNGKKPKAKAVCNYCTVEIEKRKPVIKIAYRNINIIINDEHHLQDINTGDVLTTSPLIHCPVCNKKF